MARAPWAQWPLHGSPWVLKYAYCHQMTTQTDPKGERRVSRKTNSRNFLLGTKRPKKEIFWGFKAHGSGYMALASTLWVPMDSQVPVLSPNDPPTHTWDGDHKTYQAAAVGAKGREMQSYHRDMMKVPDGKRVVSVFAALDEDLSSVDGTDTVFLPHSREGVPRPWDPIPIPLQRGDSFVLYSDLVHAGGCTPFFKQESWWRRVLFFGIATIPVTYSYMVGVRVPFWGLEESCDVDGPERCTISGCRKNTTKHCFSCGVPRLCATHEGELCLACSQLIIGSKATAVASAPPALGFPVGVTCLLPVLTSTLYLALHPVPAPPPNPFRPDDKYNVRWDGARHC